MTLIARDSTGMPVHEPVHGRAGITANSATHRDRDGRRMAWLAALSWPLPRLVVLPAKGATVQSLLLQRRARRPDRPHLADAVPEADRRAAAHLAKLTARSALDGWRSPSRAHMAEQTVSVVTVETAEQSATGASTINSGDDRRPHISVRRCCQA